MIGRLQHIQRLKNEQLVAWSLLTVAVLCWSLNTVMARTMIHEISPLALSFYRWFTALCVLFPMAFRQTAREWKVVRKVWPQLLIMAIFSITAYNTLIYLSAQYTPVTNISLIISATPALTFVLSLIFLGQKEPPSRIAGMVISLMGMLWIIFQGSWGNVASLQANAGDLISFGAIFSWAVYSVLLKRFKIDLPPSVFLLVLILFGLPIIFPFYLWEYRLSGPFGMTLQNIMTLLFLGIFPSIISYLCWNEGVKRAGPNTASMFFYLIPVFASLIAFLFLGETIQIYHLVGGGIIFGGFFFTNKRVST